MPKFGRRSKERLKGVHPDLVNVLNDVIKYYDITILEGLRSQDRQIDLYNDGKSKLDGVSQSRSAAAKFNTKLFCSSYH